LILAANQRHQRDSRVIETSPATPKRRRRERKTLTTRQRLVRDAREWGVQAILFLAAFSSVAVTLGIIVTLLTESWGFFREISVFTFLTQHRWAPQFDPPTYGVLSLVTGTLVTTLVALVVALPLGSIIAIFLSEFAPPKVR
jgi:phosphate transport system permease protein